MRGTDHVIVDAAVKAKRAQEKAKSAEPPKPASNVDKIVTAGIWVAAAGSMVAVMLS